MTEETKTAGGASAGVSDSTQLVEHQKLKSKMIHLAAQMARRQSMPSPNEWPGWGARTPQKLWKAAKKDCDKADGQCADWAYEIRKIADAL
jgi:hypothetical protein